MKVSERELTLAAAALVIALFGVTGMVARSRLEAWAAARTRTRALSRAIAEEHALIAQREAWEARYAAVADQMPVFRPDRKVETYWLDLMDSVALKNKLQIRRRQAGAEQTVGDVYELPIECRDWAGSESSLAHFLYDLQSEGAMLDVRQLSIKPEASSGLLRGRFTLYCAYLRADAADVPAAAPGTAVDSIERTDAEPENES